MKNKKQTNNKDWFKWVVIAVVLIIPFMYSFFYLKAYWNPYGKGNIDNIPVAIVNLDSGNNGKELVDSIKDSKKLKISVVSSDTAENGLNDGDYYAVIKIPKDFSSNMESVSTNDKKHATITYSPNQKSNYLASQIINSAVNTVEKSLDNKVNSEIVGGLTDQIKKVPDSLNTISNGFTTLNEGTNTLKNGSSTLSSGTSSLATNYREFNTGVSNIKEGTNTLSSSVDKLNDGINVLDESTKEFNSLSTGINSLITGVSSLKTGSDTYTTGLNSYVSSVNQILTKAQSNPTILTVPVLSLQSASCSDASPAYDASNCAFFTGIVSTYNITDPSYTLVNLISDSGTKIKAGNQNINTGISALNTNVSQLSTVEGKITKLQGGIKELKDGSQKLSSGAKTLNTGVSTLFDSSNKLLEGINTLNSGSTKLNDGIITLNNSVKKAKLELDSNISDTKTSVKKVDNLKEYSSSPVTVNTKEVNKISSYGTAFAPLFISIGLWIGCLMMFIIFYYDKKERFGILGMNDNRRVKRTLCYHGLISLSSVILGLLLTGLLDLNITNVPLYFLIIMLVGNAFMAIMEFLIMNFGDIGKFIGLILLVLQLAAAGGTFPIETVTKGFRWMHNYLPMTYTIKLLREALVKIEGSLLSKNFVVVLIIFIVFFIINIVIDNIRLKKNND